MIQIKCPRCGIEYEVDNIEPKNIRCCDCGKVYHQVFNSEHCPKWVTNMAYNIRHYGK